MRFRARDAQVRRLLQAEPGAGRPPRPGGPGTAEPQERSYFSRSFNSNVVVVMAVLLFALVVAAFINTVARCILRRRRPAGPEEPGAVDKGLDKSAIEALPVVAFGSEPLKSLMDPTGGTECVVCLSEFTTGEHIRLLPGCHHGFHLACIDTWLLSHSSCPVCRRSVLPDHDSGSARFGSSRVGSSRFGSARIASVDLEIQPSDPPPAPAPPPEPGPSSRPTFPCRIGTLLSSEAVTSILGSRRFGATRNQGPV